MASQRTESAVRTISLTPAGMSTNFIFDNIINDIVVGSTTGFRVVDCLGEKATVFLQMVGFIADYPASSAVLDVMNHNSRAPCTHCTFQYKTQHMDEADESSFKCYSHNTEVTSLHASHRRGRFRSCALRGSQLTKPQSVYMGMQIGTLEEIEQPGRWPLLKLSLELDKVQLQRKRDSSNKYVLPSSLDPYVSNIIAPDHCLIGLIDGLLHLCFKEIGDYTSDAKVSLQFEFLLCRTLKEFGIPGQSSIYNEANGVHSLSMSTLYAISTILPSVICVLKL